MGHTFILANKLCTLHVHKFADGETKITIEKDISNVKIAEHLEESEAVLSQCLIDDSSIIALCLKLNALSYDNDVRSIRLIIPYMRYARQDRQNIKGESISVIAVLRMIFAQTNKISSISFCDIHNPAILNVLPCDITYKNIFPHMDLDIISSFLAKFSDMYQGITLDNTTFVACDTGGINRTRLFNKAMSMKNDIAIIHKIRKADGTIEMPNILGETVDNRLCIIVDDIVDSAGTLCKSAELLKEKGATKIYAFITHGIFSGNAIEKINNSPIEKLFVTDTNDFDTKGSEKITTVYIPCISNPIWFT